MVLSIFGHRPDKLGGWQQCPAHLRTHQAIKDYLSETRDSLRGEENNKLQVLLNLSLGVGMWGAEACRSLRIPYCAVAYVGDGTNPKWPLHVQTRYTSLWCAAETRISISPEPYAPWKAEQGQKYIIDNSDRVLAVFNGEAKGDTYRAVQYAQSSGKVLDILDPSPFLERAPIQQGGVVRATPLSAKEDVLASAFERKVDL